MKIIKLSQFKIQYFLSLLGPGILFAGAAVGGSHLVQSTRAGAMFGFKLMGLILLVNLLKYPFFEFAQRFTTVTGKNLLQAYYELNWLYIVIFIIISFSASFVTISAVSFVAANLLVYLSANVINILWAQLLVIMLCAGILYFGKYRVLDISIKIMMLILCACVLLAVIMALVDGPQWSNEVISRPLWSFSSFTFLLALMGWMPAPIDSSAWTSLWLQERNQSVGFTLSLRQTLFDFNFGYLLTSFLAICFLSLGALVMFRNGLKFPASGINFIKQLIDLFGISLGLWGKSLVAMAAFATMLSTTLTCLDAYPRAITKSILILRKKDVPWNKNLYWFFWALISSCSVILIRFFVGNLKLLVDAATIVAFLTGPAVAYMNYKVAYSNLMPKSYQPSLRLKFLSICGLIFLGFVSIAFLGSLFLQYIYY